MGCVCVCVCVCVIFFCGGCLAGGGGVMGVICLLINEETCIMAARFQLGQSTHESLPWSSVFVSSTQHSLHVRDWCTYRLRYSCETSVAYNQFNDRKKETQI